MSFFQLLIVLYIHNNIGDKMLNKATVTTWNYLDKDLTIDLTNLDRMPPSKDPVLQAIIDRMNKQADEIEDLFIQIECDRIDREENKSTDTKQGKRKLSKKELFEDIDETTRLELLEDGFDLE